MKTTYSIFKNKSILFKYNINILKRIEQRQYSYIHFLLDDPGLTAVPENGSMLVM